MRRSDLLGQGELLDADGTLSESGYAFSQVKSYDRNSIRARKSRIKEWDSYYFCDEKFAVALTIARGAHTSLASASLIDFEHIRYIAKSKIGPNGKSKLVMPNSCSSGSVRIEKGDAEITFMTGDDGARRIDAEIERFFKKDTFRCSIELDPYCGDNITCAIPFDKSNRFCYDTKINCLKGKGRFELGDKEYFFDNGMGGFDWCRGVLPRKNRRYRASLSCALDDGTPFGLNLGYGFGMPTASENAIFFDGKANKLKEVNFDIPFTLDMPDYLKPWKICDGDGRLEMIFYPMVDDHEKTHAFRFALERHRVFGKFYGKATLDDGKLVAVTDRIGFAEFVATKW